jgi:hypothetical protein
MTDLTERRSRIYVPAFCLAVRIPAGFRKPLVHSESGLRKPIGKATGSFHLAGYDCENIFSLISGFSKGFNIHNQLIETR